jgi:hypothetical protein
MPRVVPSQVVATLDAMFTFAATQQPGKPQTLYMGHSTSVAALVRLVGEVPPELITLAGPDYVNFVSSVEALKDVLAIWRSGGPNAALWGLTYVPGLPEFSPVTHIRQGLLKCPDQAPSPTTTALAFIADAALRDNIRSDISAAHSDLRQGEWKGATVLAGSATEALLLWALQQHEQQNAGARAAAITALRAGPNPILTRNPDANPENWALHEYTEVAACLGVISADTAAQVRLARRFRNLIHPGLAQRTAQKCDIATAHGAIAAVEAVARDLTPP